MRIVLLLAGLGLAACEPRAAVTMTGDGAGYQMHFENCSRPGQTLPVQRVEVRRTPAASADEVHCSLERIGSEEALSSSWRYGQAVPGYHMRGCGPLRPGDAYEIRVSLGPVAADAVVTVGAGGALESSAGGCP
jgi:hypothetical protein